MTVLISLAAAARNIPWQAWAVAALFAAIGLYGCHERRQGGEAQRQQYERQQQEAADAAQKGVDRVLRGDRSRVMQFDRD